MECPGRLRGDPTIPPGDAPNSSAGSLHGGEAEDPGCAGRQVRAVRLRADGRRLRAGPRGAGEAGLCRQRANPAGAVRRLPQREDAERERAAHQPGEPRGPRSTPGAPSCPLLVFEAQTCAASRKKDALYVGVDGALQALGVCRWDHIVLGISARSHVDAATLRRALERMDAAWPESEERMAKLRDDRPVGAQHGGGLQRAQQQQRAGRRGRGLLSGLRLRGGHGVGLRLRQEAAEQRHLPPDP